MIPRHIVLTLLPIACMLLCSTTHAQKAPRSITEMEFISDVIVVGTIKALRSKSQPSRIESGFGNTDWVITLTLTIRDVEAGDLAAEELDVRCIRVRSRNSIFGLVSLAGHRPIPGIGTLARFYLTKDGDSWEVVMPNGIVSFNDDQNGQPNRLRDASEVRELGSTGYTFLLPVELWIFFVVLGVIAAPVIQRFRHRTPKQPG